MQFYFDKIILYNTISAHSSHIRIMSFVAFTLPQETCHSDLCLNINLNVFWWCQMSWTFGMLHSTAINFKQCERRTKFETVICYDRIKIYFHTFKKKFKKILYLYTKLLEILWNTNVCIFFLQHNNNIM